MYRMDNRPVGVFDSGVGGLTVVAEMMKQLPHEDVIYIGDTARMPYGPKSRDTIESYGREIIHFLTGQNAKAIIIACGTISSNAYEVLVNESTVPLIDVLRPGINACVDQSPRKVGFIATEATVRSGAFEQLLKKQRPEITVYSKACPLFVPLVEEGWTDNAVVQLVAEAYLEEWRTLSLDTLVLGCTHYPTLTKVLKRVLGEITFINMAEYTVRAAKKLLTEQNRVNNGTASASYQFYVSGHSDKFNRMAKLMLNGDYKAEKIHLAP